MLASEPSFPIPRSGPNKYLRRVSSLRNSCAMTRLAILKNGLSGWMSVDSHGMILT